MMIRTRFATPDDAAELIALNREFNEVDDLDIENVKRDIAANPELIAVADAGEQLAGFCCVQYYKSFCYNAGVAELTELYVRPEFRHKGLASRMIQCQVDALRKKGVDVMQVITDAHNVQGHKVYKSNGFAEQEWLCLERKI